MGKKLGPYPNPRASQVVLVIKHLPTQQGMHEMWVPSLGPEVPPETLTTASLCKSGLVSHLSLNSHMAYHVHAG